MPGISVSLNTCQIINCILNSGVAIALCLYCSCSLHSILKQKRCKKLHCKNPGHFRNAGEKNDKVSGKPYHAIANQHLALSAK